MSQLPSGAVPGLALVGAAIMVFAWVAKKTPQLSAAVATNSAHTRIARRLDPLVQGALERPMLGGGLLAAACAILIAPDRAFQPWPVLALWALGIGLFLVGIAPVDSRRAIGASGARIRALARQARWELLAVLALTLCGLVLRSFALNAIPYNVSGDEGEMGMVARAVLRGELRDPFATAWLGHPTLWFFMQALALQLFGDNISGLRTLSALLGVLALPALYIFARPLYGRAVALVGGALLAAYHLDLHYSRIGLNNIADPLMITLSLAAFFYGYRRRSQAGFALAGVLMGLAQYMYYGARLIPVLVLALLAYLAIWQRTLLFSLLRPVGLMVLGFFVAAGPLVRYFISRPDTFTGRLADNGLLQNGHLAKLATDGQSLILALAEHAYRSFALFVAVDEHGPFYDAGIPLLDPAMAVLFILGLALVLLDWRRLERTLLLLWVGGTVLFGGFLFFDAPQSQHYVIAVPALCILAALALVQIGTLFGQLTALPRRWCAGAVIFVTLGLMAWNIYFYFILYTPRNSYARTQNATEIADYLGPDAGQRYVYMFTAPAFYLRHGTIKFVAREPEGTDLVERLTSPLALPDPPAGLRPVFIFIPERLGELAMVEMRYPDGELQEYRDRSDGNRPLMYIYEPHSVMQAQGQARGAWTK